MNYTRFSFAGSILRYMAGSSLEKTAMLGVLPALAKGAVKGVVRKHGIAAPIMLAGGVMGLGSSISKGKQEYRKANMGFDPNLQGYQSMPQGPGPGGM